MNLRAAEYVFNFDALILGCVTILLCLIVQALFVMLVTSKFKPPVRRLVNNDRWILAQTVFFAGILLLLVSHLVQIYLWGLALTIFDIIPNEHQAMVFAGSTYTTVGFVNDPLPVHWQLLTVIMAASGFFSFGWSTAVMFLLSQALFPSET
ncbi:hypothetical protein [Zwartia sp.]|uniref:hypothetical protein n=1 Tax=Zwartia sp. TaxID=2978004 RepID=UPI00271CEB51|nr:hypothetical protein [Zwartia sp.]MDO9023634.1 hypothetical protein [Zwartia sp.]